MSVKSALPSAWPEALRQLLEIENNVSDEINQEEQEETVTEGGSMKLKREGSYAAVVASGTSPLPRSPALSKQVVRRTALQSSPLTSLEAVTSEAAVQAYEQAFQQVDERLSEFREHPLVQAALQRGVDLREYAAEIERSLSEIEKAHLSDYLVQSPALAQLHAQLEACATVLERMSQLLAQFQQDLKSLRGDIAQLQKASGSLRLRLVHRRAVARVLAGVLDGVVVSPELIKGLSEGEMNDQYVERLALLNKKLVYLQSYNVAHIKACRDAVPELDRLRVKATEKIRDYFIETLRHLRKSSHNLPVVQQTCLLRFRALYRFLLARHTEAAKEVRSCYTQTCAAYYYKHFGKYVTALQKLLNILCDRHDVLGACAEEFNAMAASQNQSNTSNTATTRPRPLAFVLADRLTNVLDVTQPVIIAHTQNHPVPFEQVFRSMHRVLMDSVTSEYVVARDFFHFNSTQATSHVLRVMESTLKYTLSTLKSHCEYSHDLLALLLTLRLVQQCQRAMQKRLVPCLDAYWREVEMLLWPRVQSLFDAQCRSIANATPSASVDTIVSSVTHPMAKRYAEWTTSLLLILDSAPQEMALITQGQQRVRHEVIQFLLHKQPKSLLAQLNALDAILSVLQQSLNQQQATSSFEAEVQYFQTLFDQQCNEFVGETLTLHFPLLLELIRQVDGNLQAILNPTAPLHSPTIESLPLPDKFQQVAQDFQQNFIPKLETMHSSIVPAFAHFKCGTLVLQQCFKCLIAVYQRFHVLLMKRMAQGRLPFQVLSVAQLAVEMKRFKGGF